MVPRVCPLYTKYKIYTCYTVYTKNKRIFKEYMKMAVTSEKPQSRYGKDKQKDKSKLWYDSMSPGYPSFFMSFPIP